jgi:hypothetical protein
MAIKSNITANPALVEYGKYVELINDSRFPNTSSYNGSTTLTEYPKYATLSYMVNASDIAISLSAGDLNIGNVGIIDHSSGHDVFVNVIETQTIGGTPVGAALVKTLGTTPISGGVTVLNPISSFSLVNPVTAVTVLNPVSSFTLVDPVTAVSITTNQTLPVSGSVTVLNPVSSFSLINPVTAVTVLNPVSAVSITNPVSAVSITTSQTLPVSGSVTITNPVTSVFVSNMGAVSATIIPNNNTTPLLVKNADSLQLDPLGRLRTSLTRGQWWYQSSVDKDGDFRVTESFNGLSAQSVFVQNIASVTMTPGLSSTGYAIRQTKRHFKFRPGIGTQVFMTVNWSGFADNTVKRFGQFNANEGIFWELSGTDFNTVIRRRNVDGSISEDRTNSTAFNNDKLDGTGPTGLNFFATTSATNLAFSTITPGITAQNDGVVYNVTFTTPSDLTNVFKVGTKATVTGANTAGFNNVIFITSHTPTTITGTYIFYPGATTTGTITLKQTPFHMEYTYWFDYIGGKTNRVRFVIAAPSGAVIVHTYNSAGNLGTQFINAPALPLRYEIRNLAGQTSITQLTLASEAVDVEAELELNPFFGAVASNVDVVWPTAASRAEYAILGIGLRPGEPYHRSDIQLQNIEIMDIANLSNQSNTVNAAYSWRLMFNPTLSGTLPIPINTGKSTRVYDYATGVGYVSGGYTVLQGYGVSKTPIASSPSLNFINLGVDVNYQNPDQLVLLVKQLTTGSNPISIRGAINYIEAL